MTSSPAVQHKWLSTLERHSGRWAGLIILISFLMRLWFVATGQLNLSQDEAQYWDWSRHLQLSYYSKGPLITWIIGFWTGIFGNTELGVRFGAIVNVTLGQVLLYLGTARLLGRPRLGVLSLIVANTMPLFLASGMLMTTDNILLVCWLTALFCLHAITKNPGKATLPLVLLGLCMMLGNLGKYMMLAFAATAVCHFFLLRRQGLLPKNVALKCLFAMAVGAILGYAPILVWNMQNGWVGFLHVTTLAGVTGSDASRLFRLSAVPEFLAGQFGVVTPWWMTLILFAGWRCLRTAWQGRAERDDPLSLFGQAEQVRQASLMACGFWPLWFGMFVWSFHTRIYANWPGMCYVAGIMLAASGLERLLAGYGSRRARRFAPVWPVMGAGLLVLLLCVRWIPFPPYADPVMRLKGWSDMGQKLEELRKTMPRPDKVFYFGHNYDVTAELAFYGPGQPQAYSANFGRRLSQYDFWPGPLDPASPGGVKTGWDALYVNAKEGVPPELAAMFDKCETLTYTSNHKGSPGRTFTIVRLHNFKGLWPQPIHVRY